MESGTPGRKATDDGWMNRHLQAAQSRAARRSAASRSRRRCRASLAGPAPAVAMAEHPQLRPSAAAARATAARGFEDMYDGRRPATLLHGTGRETFEAVEYLKKADPAPLPPAAGASTRAGATATA